MNKHSNLDLSTLFRRNLDALALDVVSIKQELLNKKYQKNDDRNGVFLVDQNYALNLDELI